MVVWKRLLLVLVVLFLVSLTLIFVFLKGYKPAPNRLRSLVYMLLSNYKTVSWVADLTRNQQLVLGYFIEDVIKYPENFVNQVVDRNAFGNIVVYTSGIQPSFHKDLFNLNGRVITADKNWIVIDVGGVNYVVKVRDFSLIYASDFKTGAPIINELGLVKSGIRYLINGQLVSAMVYKVAERYELFSVTII